MIKPIRSRTSTTDGRQWSFSQARRRQGGMARRRIRTSVREQLRHAPHQRTVRTDPGEAPGLDAVPSQAPLVPDSEQSAGVGLSDADRIAAVVAAGVLPAERSVGELLQAIVDVARAI